MPDKAIIRIQGGDEKEYNQVRDFLKRKKVSFVQQPKEYHWQNPSYRFVIDRADLDRIRDDWENKERIGWLF